MSNETALAERARTLLSVVHDLMSALADFHSKEPHLCADCLGNLRGVGDRVAEFQDEIVEVGEEAGDTDTPEIVETMSELMGHALVLEGMWRVTKPHIERMHEELWETELGF